MRHPFFLGFILRVSHVIVIFEYYALQIDILVDFLINISVV